MNGKITSEQGADAHLAPQRTQVEPCVKGREALAPRDLAAYLRLINGTGLEEAGVLPPHVQSHLDSCSTCHMNWNFLKRTDPILRELRQKRLGLIVRVVNAAETVKTEMERAGADFGTELAAEERNLSPEEQDVAIGEVQEALALANTELVQEAQSVAIEIRNATAPEAEESGAAGAANLESPGTANQALHAGTQGCNELAEVQPSAVEPRPALNKVCERIGDISVKVGALTDELERAATTNQVCDVFNDVFEEWLNKQYERGELPFAVLEKLMESQSKWIDLSKLPVPPEVAIAFFSSFPETINSGRQDLFQNIGDTIRFNWACYQELRKNPSGNIFGNED